MEDHAILMWGVVKVKSKFKPVAWGFDDLHSIASCGLCIRLDKSCSCSGKVGGVVEGVDAT